MNCPELSEARQKELQELVKMKVERKGHGTGRKKRKLTEKLNQTNDTEEVVEAKPSKKRAKKRPKKDKTGQLVQDGEGLFQGFRVLEEDVQRLRELHEKLQKV